MSKRKVWYFRGGGGRGGKQRETYNLRCRSSLDNVLASNAKGSTKSAAFSSIPILLLRNPRTVGEGGTTLASSAGKSMPPNETSPTSSYTHSDLPLEF